MVVSNNPEMSLRPSVMLYEPATMPEHAPIVDLAQEAAVGIVKSIPPRDLPMEVYEYLSPRERIVYFLDAAEDLLS